MDQNFLKQHGEELLALKEAELQLKQNLPHLYGYKLYTWAREFIETQNRRVFLCAGNQLSKSSTQIRRNITLATDKTLWPIFWQNSSKPNLFWYLYPTQPQATTEMETKWSEFLPRGDMKKSAEYGWEAEYKKREIHAIHFNSGVTIQMKAYSMGLKALQTSTVYHVSLDEEAPEELWEELCFRTQAVDGVITSAFTATIGQEFWRKVMEPRDRAEELFPGAWKRQISAFDCKYYEDGTPSGWTTERINRMIASCKSPQEVQRRVLGKFVKDSGLMYPMFIPEKHVRPRAPIPKDWSIYAGVDVGAGGDTSHPSTVTIIAVRPDYRFGRVVNCWRGDGVRTTASDVYLQAEEMLAEISIPPTGKFYDWASADFGEISIRNGGNWQKAEKGHELGERILNVLFRNDMLAVDENGDSGKLVGELTSVSHGGVKRNKSDDLVDSTRYCVTKIPWDWAIINSTSAEIATKLPETRTAAEVELAERRKAFEGSQADQDALDLEFQEINEAYG